MFRNANKYFNLVSFSFLKTFNYLSYDYMILRVYGVVVFKQISNKIYFSIVHSTTICYVVYKCLFSPFYS